MFLGFLMTLLQNILDLINNIRPLFHTPYNILDSQITVCIFSNILTSYWVISLNMSAALSECLPFNFIVSFCLVYYAKLSSFTPKKINFYYLQSWTIHTLPTFFDSLLSSFSVSLVLFMLHCKFHVLEYFTI